MFKKVALSLFLLITAAVIAILAIAGTRPAAYHVERSVVTTASPERAYALINDLHRFPDWSPWQKLDPAMKIDFAGPQQGVGAKYHWLGNKQVGEGRMTITDSEAPSHVGMKLEFVAPFVLRLAGMSPHPDELYAVPIAQLQQPLGSVQELDKPCPVHC